MKKIQTPNLYGTINFPTKPTLTLPPNDSQGPHLPRPQINRAKQVVPTITDIGDIAPHIRSQSPGLTELGRAGRPVLVAALAGPGQAGGGGLACCLCFCVFVCC
jgi:hypothetical protein